MDTFAAPAIGTTYQAKYFAHELSRRYPSDSMNALAKAVADGRIHGVDPDAWFFELGATLYQLAKEALMRPGLAPNPNVVEPAVVELLRLENLFGVASDMPVHGIGSAFSSAWGKRRELLMELTRYELGRDAKFFGDTVFRLKVNPFPDVVLRVGNFDFRGSSGRGQPYDFNHALAKAALARAKGRDLPCSELDFDYWKWRGKSPALQTLRGESGWLNASLATVESRQTEDHLIVTAICDSGRVLGHDVAAQLLCLPATVSENHAISCECVELLATHAKTCMSKIQEAITERETTLFNLECQNLEKWADEGAHLEREIEEIDHRIGKERRRARVAATPEEKVAAQGRITSLEAQRSGRLSLLGDRRDKAGTWRANLNRQFEESMAKMEAKPPDLMELFTIRWRRASKTAEHRLETRIGSSK